jgi:hypothetical protein
VLGLAVSCHPPPTPTVTPVAATPLGAPVRARGGVIPAGAVLVARMDRAITTDHTRPGERFTARLVTPILDERGRPLLPDDARLAGRVVSVSTGRGEGPARLYLAVDGLQAARCAQPIDTELWAADVAQVARAAPGRPMRGGAVGGAFLGALFLGIPGLELGAGLGAAGGVATYEASRVIDARLERGALIVVQLQSATRPSPSPPPSYRGCA